MLKEYYDVEIKKLYWEIQKLCVKRKSFESHKLYEPRKNQLSLVFKQHNKDVIRKKDKKFFRDQLPFKNKFAYKWLVGTRN